MKLKTLLLSSIASLFAISSCSAETTEVKKKQEAVWTNLLEGDSLDLWKSSYSETDILPSWSLKDGVLHFKKVPKTRHCNLLTKKAYYNFELKFEFKSALNSNSGIKYRAKGRLGLEYQIIDDINYRDNKNPTHRTAALYDLMAIPETRILHPAEEWNTGRIVADGNNIQHWLNGVKVLTIEYGSDKWAECIAQSKYRDKPEYGTFTGPITLQDHHDEVSFRNLFVREIKTLK